MKSICQKFSFFLFLVLGLTLLSSGQTTLLPEELIGKDLSRAQKSLREAIEAGQDSLVIDLAEVYFYDGKYEEALKEYQRADILGLVTTPEQKRNYTHVARMQNVISPYDIPTGYFNKSWAFEAELEAFCGNSANEDFAPFKWKNLLFITSSRNESRRIYEFTSKPFLDVFAFSGDCDLEVLPSFLPRNLNTRWHDGPIAIAADTSLIVITRNYDKPNENGFHNLYMEYFVRENGNWQKAKKFPFANADFSVQHPFFHDAENTLYFASNFRGGHGGFDLYKSKWNGNEWENPVNLGPEINSRYDEVFPSFTPKGELIFSTNHIETQGGLDLVLFSDGMRTLFPAPFNTPYDDFSITYENERSGYIASNRTGGTFGDNVYAFSIPEPAPVEYFFLAKVVEKETKEPLEGALVAFSSFDSGISGSMITDENGLANLFQSVAAVPEFQFEVSKTGFQTLEITTNQFDLSGPNYAITFELEKITEPVIVEAPTPSSGTFVLYFENDLPATASGGLTKTARYDLTHENFLKARTTYVRETVSTQSELQDFFYEVEQGMLELEAFAGFLLDELRKGEEVLIDLAAYASPLATSQYNARLSERRNASVKNFLLGWENGVLEAYLTSGNLRFVDKAYGDSQAPAGISDSPSNRRESVYSVRAARERRVVLFWKKITDNTGAKLEVESMNPFEFFIVVGSFKNKNLAEKNLNMVSRQQAANPGILEIHERGLFREYFNAYKQLEMAQKDLSAVQQTIAPDAWIVSL